MKIDFNHLKSTLRGRLALWYFATIFLIVLLILTIVSLLFQVVIKDQIDHHVQIAVAEAKQIVENYRGQERDNLIKNLVSERGMTVVVLSPDGAPLLETNSPDVAIVTEHQLQKILTSSQVDRLLPARFTENNIRFAALPALVSAGQGIVAVGYSTRILSDTFLYMIAIIIGITAMLVLFIAFVGQKYLNKELRPLEKIVSQAKDIDNSLSLSKRINIKSRTEELTVIQDSLNTMLDKIERLFSSERVFFSDAAHTLKTPLAVIASQVENSRLPEKSKFSLLKTIGQASDTVQDLLFLSKIDSKPANKNLVSISDMMADLTELASSLGETKHLQITSEIEKNISLKTDKKLLLRALSNLVHNAVTYNKTNGRLYLSLKRKTQKIIITIKDTGQGIAKKDLVRIFDRFYRADKTRGGSGLGLAIAKSAIESLGGKISLTSRLHHGTTITVSFRTLPAGRQVDPESTQ